MFDDDAIHPRRLGPGRKLGGVHVHGLAGGAVEPDANLQRARRDHIPASHRRDHVEQLGRRLPLGYESRRRRVDERQRTHQLGMLQGQVERALPAVRATDQVDRTATEGSRSIPSASNSLRPPMIAPPGPVGPSVE